MANHKRRITNVKVMIGCPEDAEIYLKNVKEGIKQFNEEHGDEFGVKLEPCHYKDHTYSSVGNTQEQINKQLCDDCGILIAVFYLTAGSANVSEDVGTLSEIKYFGKKNKQAFIFRYDGDVTLTCDEKKDKFADLTYLFKENKDKVYYVNFNEDDLGKVVKNQLKIYYESKKRESSRRKGGTNNKNHQDSLQDKTRKHIIHCDEWNSLSEAIKLSEKAETLINGMRDDGAVQYYLDSSGRYRTTPVASVLIALSIADLLPLDTRHTMQDWIFASKNDPCDEPNDIRPAGHKPNPEDEPGWSINEGVSVWTTSKALESLITTGYFDRADIKSDKAKQDVVRKALFWLVDQAYESGGWGFQNYKSEEACQPCVTMTALTLKVISEFWRRKPVRFSSGEIKKLSDAKKSGIDYLLDNMKTEAQTELPYWEYEGKPSLTATVWVLDFINTDKKSAGGLYDLRKKIYKYCLSKMPETMDDFDQHKEEVYFAGGQTKYKEIPKNSKFYSYLPYHVHSLMDAGVKPWDGRILVCINALVTGDEEYWFGQDQSSGGIQSPSSFAWAMALSVVAKWSRKISKEILSPVVKDDEKIKDPELIALLKTLYEDGRT